MIIDPSNLNRQDSAHLLADIVVPRPIAWVSTLDEAGTFNLAPFSTYIHLSTKPMIIGFSSVPFRDGRKKDTLVNIESTGEFVINAVTEDLAEAMNVTSTPYSSDVSEFEKGGLTPEKADLVKAPMVAEAPVNMECRLNRIIVFGEAPLTTSFIIGDVLRIHIKEGFYNTDTGRVSGLRPVGRLGGNGDLYLRASDIFEMERPSL